MQHMVLPTCCRRGQRAHEHAAPLSIRSRCAFVLMDAQRAGASRGMTEDARRIFGWERAARLTSPTRSARVTSSYAKSQATPGTSRAHVRAGARSGQGSVAVSQESSEVSEESTFVFSARHTLRVREDASREAREREGLQPDLSGSAHRRDEQTLAAEQRVLETADEL